MISSRIGSYSCIWLITSDSFSFSSNPRMVNCCFSFICKKLLAISTESSSCSKVFKGSSFWDFANFLINLWLLIFHRLMFIFIELMIHCLSCIYRCLLSIAYCSLFIKYWFIKCCFTVHRWLLSIAYCSIAPSSPEEHRSELSGGNLGSIGNHGLTIVAMGYHGFPNPRKSENAIN